MAEENVAIQLKKNGPYLVRGVKTLLDAEGNSIEVREVYSLCRCGGSKRKPFCDGTHKTISFNDEV